MLLQLLLRSLIRRHLRLSKNLDVCYRNCWVWTQAILVMAPSCTMLMHPSRGQVELCVCFVELFTVLIFHAHVFDVAIAIVVIALLFVVFVNGAIRQKQVAASAVERILLPCIECRLRLSIN
jgi:hypothetical protein